MRTFKLTLKCQRGQGLIELGLSLPLLLILSLGAVEVSYMIDTWLVLSHLTREGANMISLGTPADKEGPNNDALDAITTSACPHISNGTGCGPANLDRWTIIYSHIGPNPDDDDEYVVLEQSVRGTGEVISEKRVCPSCALSNFTSCTSCVTPSNIPHLETVAAGTSFNVIEVFYEYEAVTPVKNFGIGLGNNTFYERAIF